MADGRSPAALAPPPDLAATPPPSRAAPPPASPRPRSALEREGLPALAAMLVAVPAAIANGLVAYAPLGPAFTGAGALAGIAGAAALGTLAPLLGGTPGLVSAPSPAASAFLAVVVAHLLQDGVAPAAIPGQLALVVVVAGAVQVAIGALRAGRLVKYLPYSVVAGYLTGGGLLILHLQLGKLAGAPSRWGALEVLGHPEAWRAPALAISGVTLAVTLLAPRVTRRVPATLLGLAAGVVVHRLLALALPELARLEGNPLLVGPVLSGAGAAGPADALRGLAAAFTPSALGAAVVPSLTLAVLLSIDTLKTCLLVDGITRGRHDSDRELVAQGIGNAASAVLGGAAGTGIVSGSLVNVTAGARTRWSGAIAGLLALGVLVALGPAVAWLPVPALAAVVALMAWRMLQRELLELVRDRTTLLEFAVAAAVVGVAVVTNLAAAAGVGVLLSVLLFLAEQVRAPVVRRALEGGSVSAHRRGARAAELLRRHGRETLLLELQGSLFFGSVDRLATEIEARAAERRVVILELARVRAIDLSAVHALKQIAGRLADRGARLVFCELPGGRTGERLRRYLARLGLDREPLRLHVFPHVDDALGWAEEQVLGASRPAEGAPLPLEEIDPIRGLAPAAVEALRAVARERHVEAGDRIFASGDEGRDLFLVRSGEVRVLAPLEGGRNHLVTTLGPGDFFGDLAFLDGEQRSLDARALRATRLYALAPEDVARAAATCPGLETILAARIATSLAMRLRRATAEALALREA